MMLSRSPIISENFIVSQDNRVIVSGNRTVVFDETS